MSEPIANAGLSAMSDADSLAQTVRRYRREIASALIAVKWHLDTPYPDSPEWTPWTRFVERALRKVDEIPALADDLVGQLAQAEREKAALREALQQIADTGRHRQKPPDLRMPYEIARAALASSGSAP